MPDFTKFHGVSGTQATRPTDPESIFKLAPKRSDSFPDIWRGQADALRQWYTIKDQSDVLISLNTGAGKTLIGLLIAQSFVNEGIENVVYACGTIDLVNQTAKEAQRLGLTPTLRIKQQFSNGDFEAGKSFCITTYQSLFNPFSRFRTKFTPGAIIFDDAHASEGYLRDAFTTQVSAKNNPDTYGDIVKVVAPAFVEIGKPELFSEVVSHRSTYTLLVPPFFVYEHRQALARILGRLAEQLADVKFRWNMIADYVGYCAVLIDSDGIEITPPFLPIRALPYFSEQKTRRVYLSATINYISDLIRCCGRRVPDKCIVSPRSDAGEGERLILFSKYLPKGAPEQLAAELSAKHKLLVCVPSYVQARRWDHIAVPPSVERFSVALADFRESDRGAFMLVHRLDGIDLLHDACRLMLMDGLPTGASALERFQWQVLGFRNALAAKFASRITQILGRINRGTRDYSIHLIDGTALNNWLSNDRHLALLSPLLRDQVVLGHELQDQLSIKSVKSALELVEQVLKRDSGWLDLYKTHIQEKQLDPIERDRSEKIEQRMISAAEAEVRFADAIWQGDVNGAREALENVAADVARGDTKLAGWMNLWIGFCFDVMRDHSSAMVEYKRAKQQLGALVPLPIGRDPTMTLEELSGFQSKLRLILMTSAESYNRQLRLFESSMAPLGNEASTPSELEECVRVLGEYLGLSSTRPDNDLSAGPDVLWLDEENHELIGIELKTDKKANSTYTVSEIGKILNYEAWIRDQYQEYKFLAMYVIGPRVSASRGARPSDRTFLVDISDVQSIAARLQSFIVKARSAPSSDRLAMIKKKEADEFGLHRICEVWSARRLDAI